MAQSIYQVDAFASGAFTGNPAAVCVLDGERNEGWMKAVAAEMNLSETAFLRPEGDAWSLRWFTPALEVDLCGHATLASGQAVFSYLRPGTAEVRFHSRSGPLTVTRDGEVLTMDFQAQPPRRASGEEAAAVSAALGSVPLEVWRDEKFLALLPDEAAVRNASPHLAKVASLPGDGLIVSARGSAYDFVSRYFAPAAGIDEDAVTGSAHCVLAPFWAKRLQRNPLRARQVSQRGGDLLCRVRRSLVASRVGGPAHAWHAPGIDPARPQRCFSVSKSLTGVLAARAVEDQHRAQIRPDDVNRARDRARRLAEMSRTSSDAAAIYERVMTLGARHGVRIDRMEPARVAARRAAARPAGAAPVAQTIGFTVSLIADYEALGAFIDAVERDTGFSSVESIRLTPLVIDGAELVQAVLETRHRGFPGVSSALASAKEQSP